MCGGSPVWPSPATTKPIVPATAIGKPSAADVATQLRMPMLQAVMNGTDRKAPPAPTMLETSPMPPPTANSPPLPGSSRVGLGLRSSSMLVAAAATNTPKKADNTAVDMPPTICGPTSEPTMIPGANAATTGHRIARCR